MSMGRNPKLGRRIPCPCVKVFDNREGHGIRDLIEDAETKLGGFVWVALQLAHLQ